MKNQQEEKSKKSVSDKTEKLKKSTKRKKSQYVKKGGNGGARQGSGRKKREDLEVVKKIKEIIEMHGIEEVYVQKGGKVEKLTRVAVLLESLYREGANGNVQAIKEYFDRQIGRSKESLALETAKDNVFNIKLE